MGDLQCPATVLVVPPGWDAGAVDASWADAPHAWPGPLDATVALVLAAPSRVETAQALAARVGAGTRVVDGLGGSSATVVAAAIEDATDLARGELVLVLPTVSPPGCPADAPAWLSIDDDGWVSIPRNAESLDSEPRNPGTAGRAGLGPR